MSNHKNHTPEFKARVALAALSGEKAIADLSSKFGIQQTLIYKWKRQLKESATGIFSGEPGVKQSIKGEATNDISYLSEEERDFLLKNFR